MSRGIRKALELQDLHSILAYDPETGAFIWKRARGGKAIAGATAGIINRDGYRRIAIYKKPYMAHRLAWFYVHGVWPEKFIDHIDGNPANNAISNLRQCSHSENHQNRVSLIAKPSHLIGAQKVKGGKWRARICAGGKQIYIGTFDTPEEAASAYREAKKKHHPFQPSVRGIEVPA